MVRRMLLATATLGLLATPSAVGAQPDADAPQRAGIAHAKAAGIYVDPAVEDMMARAPIGSCANDPTLSECPPARAIVLAGASEAAGFSAGAAQTFAPLAMDSNAALAEGAAAGKTAAVAVAAGPAEQCGVHVSPDSPRRSEIPLRARMDAQNYCLPTVTMHELYTRLLKFWDFQWVQMATDWHRAAGGQRIDVSTYHRCTNLSQRFWRAQADAYALLQGIWYGATQARNAYVNCA